MKSVGWCSNCRQHLPREQFHKAKNRSNGVGPWCKPCTATKDKERAIIRNASTKAWMKNNRTHWNKYMREWRRRVGHKSKRNGSGRTATNPWANQFFIDEIYSLARLRTEITGIQWEVDHDIPIHGKNVCGLHVENNLRVIPMVANRRKQNKFSESRATP